MTQTSKIRWNYNDAGYEKYKNELPNDSYTRAIAIALNLSYRDAYNLIDEYIHNEELDEVYINNCRSEVVKDVVKRILKDRGWEYVSKMRFGTGCILHLKKEELPSGTIIVQISKGLTTLIDGVINDIYDPSRNGTRCVYSIWTKPTPERYSLL